MRGGRRALLHFHNRQVSFEDSGVRMLGRVSGGPGGLRWSVTRPQKGLQDWEPHDVFDVPAGEVVGAGPTRTQASVWAVGEFLVGQGK